MPIIFDTKPDSGYDNLLPTRYHFPNTKPYRAVAESAIGDWVLFRKPRTSLKRCGSSNFGYGETSESLNGMASEC